MAIVAPRIAATRRNDGSIDLVDLVQAPAPGPATTASEARCTRRERHRSRSSRSRPPAIERRSASTSPTRSLTTPATTTTFDAIDLKLDRVALQGDAPTDFALSLRTPDEGTIETKGTLVLAQRKASGTFQLRHFRPGAFANYLATFAAARIGDGTVELDANFAIDASGPELLGRIDRIGARIEKLRSQLPNEKTAFVAADAIALEGGSYDIATHAFAADALVLTAPVVAVARDAKGRLNLQAAVIEKAPDTARTAAPKDVALVVKPADARSRSRR